MEPEAPGIAGIPIRWVKRLSQVTAGQVAAQGAGFLFLVALAWIYSPVDYGYLRYAISVGTFAGTIISAGIPAALGLHLARTGNEPERRDNYFTNAIAMNLAVAGGAAALLLVIYRDPAIALIATGIAATGIYQGIIRGLLLYGRIAGLLLAGNLLKLALLGAAAYALGLRDLVGPLLIVAGAPLIVLAVLVLLRPLPPRFRPSLISRPMMTEIGRFSTLVTVSALSLSGLGFVVITVLQQTHGYLEVAVFGVAQALVIPFSIAVLGVNTLLFPKVAGADSEEKREALARLALRFSLAVSAFFVVLYLAAGGWAVSLIFGAQYAAAIPALLVMSFGAVFGNLHTTWSGYFEGSDRPHLTTFSSLLGLFLCVALALALIPGMGALGAGFAVLGGQALSAGTDAILWSFRGRFRRVVGAGRDSTETQPPAVPPLH